MHPESNIWGSRETQLASYLHFNHHRPAHSPCTRAYKTDAMSSELRQRLPKARHSESDTAVVQADHDARQGTRAEDLKRELADQVDAWKEKVKQVRDPDYTYVLFS